MIKYFTLFYTVIIATLLAPIHVQAVEVNDIYQAQVIVDSQSSTIRTRALKSAMRNVLIKASGIKEVSSNSILRQALNNPNPYLLQYRYGSIDDNRLLIVDFDESKINKLLNTAQQPIWGKFRPQILLWLVEENGLKRRIYSNSDDSAIANHITKLSKDRGLPVIQPLMDFEDINQVSVAEVWGRFAEPINVASQRYTPEKNVIIRVSNHQCLLCDKADYIIDWSIIEEENQTFSEPYQGTNSEALIDEVVNDLTRHILQQYALEVTTANELQIDINNINNLIDYTKLTEFFATLSAVQQVTLVQVNEEYYRFKLTFIGAESTLFSSFKLSNKLTPYIDTFAERNNSDVSVFSWQHH